MEFFENSYLSNKQYGFIKGRRTVLQLLKIMDDWTALKTLKAHGLQGRALLDVTHATLVSQITYYSPSCRGFIKAEEIARLNAIHSKACRFGYLPTNFHPLDDLLDASDESLFTSTRYNPQHILHQLLPPPKQISYNLCSRGHGLTLSAIPSEFMRKNFLYRMLFNDCIQCFDALGWAAGRASSL